MLYQITWQHYLLYVAIALALWYGAVLWLYYREEAKRFLHKFNKNRPPDEGLPDEDWPDEELLGLTGEEYGVSIAGSGDISFVTKARQLEEPGHDVHEDALRGLIPDILEEIKSIIYTINSESGTKEDFISLFKLVSSKYQKVKGSPHFDAVNEWVSANIPFELTTDELSRLWNEVNPVKN